MRTGRKTGRSYEEHVELGEWLADVQGRLTSLVVELHRDYPLNSQVMRRAERVEKQLSELRSALDDAVYREHGEACAHVYYPGGELVQLPHDCATRRRRADG